MIRHAVRLAYLQGDGLEKTFQVGLMHSFSKVQYIDPQSFITKDDRINLTPRELLLKAEFIRTPESYDDDVKNIGTVNGISIFYLMFYRNSPTAVFCFSDTHGIVSPSIWNRVPFFHILQPGSLAPCMAHDLNGGIFKTDISLILSEFSSEGHMSWASIQNCLTKLRAILRFEDKADLSTR